MVVCALDQLVHPLLLLEDEASSVKRVWSGFVGKKSELSRIGREEIVVRCEAAHLGHIHISRIGNQKRSSLQSFRDEMDPVVPVHIRLQVVVDEKLGREHGEAFDEVLVDPDGTVSSPDITGKEGSRRLDPKSMGACACGGQKCGRAS
jgi:hypothetical protein